MGGGWCSPAAALLRGHRPALWYGRGWASRKGAGALVEGLRVYDCRWQPVGRMGPRHGLEMKHASELEAEKEHC